MLVIEGRNVNDIYAQARQLVRQVGITSTSRAGDVLVAPYPVMSVYARPCERVLWDAKRDANPFFHLMESIWMLAGRDDAEFLNRYVKDFGARFAEDGGRLHGAYGARWRYHWDHDQLRVVIERLRRDNNDRRGVIAMWDPDHDLWSKDEWADNNAEEKYVEPKDLPCNTHIYPRVVDGRLDITVCCRSNDIVWGAYGANAVHFSVLQEYLAAAVGVEVGTMYQLSNNWHAYVDVLEKMEPEKIDGTPITLYEDLYLDMGSAGAQVRPMVTDPENFLRDCETFCDGPVGVYSNPWFKDVAAPLSFAHSLWKMGEKTRARETLDTVIAADWRLAAARWMDRRLSREQ